MIKIGEFAKQTGVSVATLRYYESLEMLEPAERTESGYRYYAETSIQKVQFIKKAQALQFSLEEIKAVLATREDGNPACTAVKALLKEKIHQVDGQIRSLCEFKVELEHYSDQWADRSLDQPDNPRVCSLIDEVVVSSPNTDLAVTTPFLKAKRRAQ